MANRVCVYCAKAIAVFPYFFFWGPFFLRILERTVSLDC